MFISLYHCDEKGDFVGVTVDGFLPRESGMQNTRIDLLQALSPCVCPTVLNFWSLHPL